MTEAARIEVLPLPDGSWAWREQPSGAGDDGFQTRREAVAAAERAAGVETVNVTRADGTVLATTRTGARLPVVLLRLDGTLVGEITPAAGPGGLIVPAGTAGDGNGA